MSGVVHATAGRLVEILGVSGALKFAEAFGGRRLYLPQPERLKPEGRIVAVVGFEAARKLAFEWRGLEVMVPKCAAYLQAQRDRAIHEDSKTLSYRALAEKYQLTERRIGQILEQPAPEAPGAAAARAGQGDFFGR